MPFVRSRECGLDVCHVAPEPDFGVHRWARCAIVARGKCTDAGKAAARALLARFVFRLHASPRCQFASCDRLKLQRACWRFAHPPKRTRSAVSRNACNVSELIGPLTQTSITWSWSSPNGRGLPIQRYTLRHANASSPSDFTQIDSAGAATSVTVSNLTASTAYVAWVRACTSVGCSNYSALSLVVSTSAAPPTVVLADIARAVQVCVRTYENARVYHVLCLCSEDPAAGSQARCQCCA